MIRWPGSAVGLMLVGLAILALPARFEGPVLLEVGDGHAISTVDLLGILPLVVGSSWLHKGLLGRSARIRAWIAQSPGLALAVFCSAAFGLGLLLASSFSRFFWWWAIGAGLLLGAHVPVILAVQERDGAAEQGHEPGKA